MRKRNYKAVSVKQIELEKLLDALDTGRVIFSVDLAKVKQFSAFMNPGSDPAMVVKWEHPKETSLMVDLVAEVAATGRSVEVVMEPTGTYGDAIRHQFRLRGIDVYRVSAKHAKDAHELFDGVPSLHDRKAAPVIGWLHSLGKSRLWREEDRSRRDAKAASSLLDVYDKRKRRALNRIEALLARHWPELLGLLELTSAALLTLVSEYGSPAMVAEHTGKAARLMRRAARGRIEPKKVDAVLASTRSCGEPMSSMEREVLKELATEAIDARKKHALALKRVQALGKDDEVVGRMSTVLGTTTAMVTVAWAGDPTQFKHLRAYYKAFGLNLAELSSGKKGERAPRLRISKRGPAIARRWLFLAALRWIQRDPLVSAWYAAKVKRDGGVKMKAVVAVMRKLLAGVWHVAQGAVFDTTKLFDASRLGIEGVTTGQTA
jgi:transposase